MSFLILGFITGLSLIFAIGAQNIFVIEQGLKKQYVFLVCLICSISDLILIFLGIFLFEYFKIYFTKNVELIFNILLFIFLIYFYSDTVFFLGNFSKNFLISHKYFFGIGAAIASFLFFFSLGYLAKFFSNYLIDSRAWKIMNFFIIIFMTVLSSYVFIEIIDLI